MSTSSTTYGPTPSEAALPTTAGEAEAYAPPSRTIRHFMCGELAVRGGAVLVVELRRVAVDVAEEGLEPVVDDLDRLAGAQRQQAGVDLHRQVLAAAERAADAGERHPHLVLGQAEDGGDLAQVGVQPLGGDVEVDAAVLGGHGEAGLRAEEGLVLHAEGVLALDDDVGALARPRRRRRGRSAGGGRCSGAGRGRCGGRRGPRGCRIASGRGRGGLVGDDRAVRAYSTLILAAARRAVSGWSAATSATGSPWWRTLPWARTGVSWISRP